MEDILKIVRSLEDSELLLKGVSEAIQNEAKEQNGRFLSMLLGTLGASLFRDMLFGKKGKEVIRVDERTIRAGYGSKRSSLKKNLITPHPLTNFEIQAPYQNEPRFNSVRSRDILPERSSTNEIKNGAYVINLDEYSDIQFIG